MISEASSLRKGTSTQMRSKTQLMDSTQSKYCETHFFLWCAVRQHCQTGLSKVAFCWQKLLSTVWCEPANPVGILYQFFRKQMCKKACHFWQSLTFVFCSLEFDLSTALCKQPNGWDSLPHQFGCRVGHFWVAFWIKTTVGKKEQMTVILMKDIWLPFTRWANLRNAADIKKARLDKALRLQQFHADIHETKVYILQGINFCKIDAKCEELFHTDTTSWIWKWYCLLVVVLYTFCI